MSNNLITLDLGGLLGQLT